MNNFSWKEITSINNFESRLNAFVASDKASVFFNWNFRLVVENKNDTYRFRLMRKSNRINNGWQFFLSGDVESRRVAAAGSLWHKLENVVNALDWSQS